MKISFRVAKLFNIDIRLHLTFFILPVLVSLVYYHQYGFGVGLRAFCLVIFVFLCVLGHELCHSLMAKRYGIAVPEITLYLIGGVASMHRIPRQPKKEFMISIVGPLFNFLLALLSYWPLYFLIGNEKLHNPSLDSWSGTLANLFWINSVLGLFNLIPAFPMDGGRIFRSVLAFRLDYLQATRISVYLGRVFAIIFFLLGIRKRHVMLIFIAFFVYASASDEFRSIKRNYELNKESH